ncbi:MAG: DUF547 domain-containing protein, partial [Flavobacteriaceae bacterium]|nr:DUF547 domain-containing protein [Flavobacteriaceae bacterium]
MDGGDLPVSTYENTMEEQMVQLEEEDVYIDLSISSYTPIELMSPEEIEATFTRDVPATVEKVEKEFNHSVWASLLKEHVSEDGSVDYNGFKGDWNQLRKYIKELASNLPDSEWGPSAKMAYWINAYNALTIDLILRHYPLKSIKEINQPWKQRYWQLGEKWYNLDEIEHQILRKMGDARIHFAIVCASYSCPKLSKEAYLSASLDKQLTQATKIFLADPDKNKLSQDMVELSKIFQWFAKDFKQNGTL